MNDDAVYEVAETLHATAASTCVSPDGRLDTMLMAMAMAYLIGRESARVPRADAEYLHELVARMMHATYLAAADAEKQPAAN